MLFIHVAAWAQTAAGDRQTELKAALAAADKAQTRGPSEIKLAHEAVLRLPKGLTYVPPAEGGQLLKVMGNRVGDNLLGLVLPEDGNNWLIVMRLVKAGYIKDDDAKDWRSDELLANLKAGTDEANKDRRERGLPELEIVGWVEPPAYDAATHRLVWSLASKQKGEPDNAERGVNYNTYALGREGYISMNLVTGMNSVQSDKPIAHRLLAALEYNDGKRYSDFNSATDHVAEYGLAALIGGVAAKKLGVLALLAAFLLKFAKVIGIAAIGVIAVLAKLLGRKKQTPPA